MRSGRAAGYLARSLAPGRAGARAGAGSDSAFALSPRRQRRRPSRSREGMRPGRISRCPAASGTALARSAALLGQREPRMSPSKEAQCPRPSSARTTPIRMPPASPSTTRSGPPRTRVPSCTCSTASANTRRDTSRLHRNSPHAATPSTPMITAGHGRTGLQQWNNDYTRLGRLGPGGVRATVAAIRVLTDIAHREHPELPVVLLGHSLGSIFAQMILNGSRRRLCGGRADRHRVSHAAAHELRGSEQAARAPGQTGHEWLSRDSAVRTTFMADPLTFDAQAAKLFGIRDGLRLLGSAAPPRPRPADADPDRQRGSARRPEERRAARRRVPQARRADGCHA